MQQRIPTNLNQLHAWLSWSVINCVITSLITVIHYKFGSEHSFYMCERGA